MNILRITLFDGTSWYHAKPKLALDNTLRLTQRIADAQTYASLESAKLGSINFINKLRRKIRYRMADSYRSAVDHAAESYFKEGKPIVIEICAATISVSSIEHTTTYTDATLNT